MWDLKFEMFGNINNFDSIKLGVCLIIMVNYLINYIYIIYIEIY